MEGMRPNLVPSGKIPDVDISGSKCVGPCRSAVALFGAGWLISAWLLVGSLVMAGRHHWAEVAKQCPLWLSPRSKLA